jgi:hypothetical protein
MVQQFRQLYILRRINMFAGALAYCHDALLSYGLDLLHEKTRTNTEIFFGINAGFDESAGSRGRNGRLITKKLLFPDAESALEKE